MKPSERIKEIFKQKLESEDLRTMDDLVQFPIDAILQYLDEKHEKLHSATKLALEHLESSGRREDIQQYLREALE